MGGQHETTCKGPAKSSVKSPTTVKPTKSTVAPINPVRYHESQGLIHFHDDIAGLKVAIPIAEFWDGWKKTQTHSWGTKSMAILCGL